MGDYILASQSRARAFVFAVLFVICLVNPWAAAPAGLFLCLVQSIET